jgi:hypothetical protein
MGLFGTKNEKTGVKPDEGNGSFQAPPSSPTLSAQQHASAQHHAQQAGVGIDHAIRLMRSLPQRDKDIPLVVRVLKTTLESLNIRVADIIADAKRRQQELEARVAHLKGEISSLEKEVERRVEEIRQLEAAHSETTKVKDRLEMEEELEVTGSIVIDNP